MLNRSNRSPQRLRQWLLSGAVCAGLAIPGTAGAELYSLEEIYDELSSGATFNVKSSVDYYYDDFPEGSGRDDTDFEGTIRYGVKSDAYIGDTTFLRVELLGWASTIENSVRGVFSRPGTEDRQANFIDIRILSIAEETDWGEVIVGKDLISFGASELYSPTNIFGRQVGIHPVYAEDDGAWQASANYFLGDDTVSYRVLPFHERDPSPDGVNRWLGSGGSSAFQELPDGVDANAIEERYHDSNIWNWGHLLSLDAVRSGYDFYAFVNRGFSTYPVLVTETAGLNTKTLQVYPRATMFGGGASVVEDAWKFTVEGVQQIADDDLDEDFFRYSLGVSYRETDFANEIGLNEIKPILEYAGEETTDEQDEDVNLISNSRSARTGRHTALGRLEVEIDDTWSSSAAMVYNLSTHDSSQSLGVRYKHDDNTLVDFAFGRFQGGGTTEFGRQSNNDFLSITLDYTF